MIESPSVREGSSLYYALWGLDDALRERALARLAFGTALADAVNEVREPDVARRKIHWWHEELERLHAGAPRHPAAVACADLAGSDTAMARALDALGAAAEERLSPADDQATLEARLARGAGARLWLVLDGIDADALDGQDTLPDAWTGLATGLALHERLARLAELLSREHPVFPLQGWQRHDARPADIASEDPVRAARGRQVVDEALARAVQVLDGGIEAAAGACRRGRPARAALVLGRLRRRQLAAWQAQQAELVRVRSSLTPIRKLFIAWRSR